MESEHGSNGNGEPAPNGEGGVPLLSEEDIHGTPDASLGGYFREHSRPPAFEGPDGEPYTVSLEAEKTPDLRAPYEGYLVFPRWAATGLGVVGHVETPTLARAATREEVENVLREIPLSRVKELLDEAVEKAIGTEAGNPPPPPPPDARTAG